MELFGEWLQKQRKERNLTREEFSERVGCSVAMLRKIEDGERHPSKQIAELIASCLDIPSGERSTFVKVARGELRVDRLPTAIKLSVASINSRSTLPVLPTPMIGRQAEVEQLGQLLRDPQCRLLTLVGPGGIGKTRLAIETASQLQEIFADGVFFVPLAPVNTTRFIVPLIADAIGFTFQSGMPADPKMQLFSYLKEKTILLLIDNLEHLLAEPGFELLAELLANAPGAKLLVTSRESSGLQGEWVFEVQGLPVPENGQAEESVQNTSLELFLQRARRAHVKFTPTPKDYPAILHICQLVDGNPLAIELAAAWVRILTCAEIASEIEHGLDFLSLSARDLPARHRSMRAVFDHSWKLLPEEEQGVLRLLSVFRGGFRREAASEVAGAMLSTLSTLVTKSLIRRNGTGRYDLHELVRQFANEQCAECEVERTAAQARHGSFYLAFFGQASGRLGSAAQREALAELTAEMDNFRSAWDWAITHGEFGLIQQTLRTFAMLYDTRAWYQEGIETLDRAANMLESVPWRSQSERINQVSLGHILATRSMLASRLGQYEQAQTMLERSLEILRPLNEPGALVEALFYLGSVMEMTGDYGRALDLYTEGLDVAKAVGDRYFAALCLTARVGLLGVTQMIVRPEITHERLQSVVSEWRAIGDPRFTAFALQSLSWSALRLERYDEARTALEESAALSISVGDRSIKSFADRGLGIIAQTQGEHKKAVEMFRKSLDIFSELGARQEAARILSDLGRSVFALGNSVESEQTWRESLRIANETQGIFIELEALVGFASLQAKQGMLEPALEMLLIVLNHPAITESTKKRAQSLHGELEAQLTNQQIQAAQVRAKNKYFETVVEELLVQGK